MQRNVIQTLGSIAHNLNIRDKYSEGHALRVSVYSKRLAARLNLPKEEIENIRMGGLLHDIGKVGFSDNVFRNEKRRPPKEIRDEIRKHPSIGRIILKNLHLLSAVIDYVYCHHEREDGSGYPRGIIGEKIPLGAKIIAIADTFDAITTDRPYQKGRTPAEALVILRKDSGKKFDSRLVEAFIAEIEENGVLEKALFPDQTNNGFCSYKHK
ncbi:MAG TPA: HD domain-containing protein [Deltaproteobacteria bacterium]|jgi:putative nucleotidyltransferase with HDIG domain|nr:HD domain-containing protein [Deltaproteobacteria bacterium]HQJ08164.1 HD domain-containing protein [Deltaproteobacteria bacterium]